MTERFSRLRSRMDADLHPSSERWSNGCGTRILCREEGPLDWPPSSRESLLLVSIPKPARDWPLGCSELVFGALKRIPGRDRPNLAVLSMFLGVFASSQDRYVSWAEAERGTLWRSLCPEAPRVAGVTETISWGHWGGTIFWGVYRSSPEGSAPSYPELSGTVWPKHFIEDDGPQIRHFSWLRPGAPPTLLTLRRGASGNAPFLDFSIWGASTLLGLTPPISPSLRIDEKILLKLVYFP